MCNIIGVAFTVKRKPAVGINAVGGAGTLGFFFLLFFLLCQNQLGGQRRGDDSLIKKPRRRPSNYPV